jgi:peptidoglycan/LPS O-acetylase OafA/YrhL
MKPTVGRIEYLDWLRALAALMVVFGHSHPKYAPGGALGVSIFFVLSGYLIASILFQDGMLTAPNIGRFIARRIARIYPMYAVQIGLVVLLLYATNRDAFHKVIPFLPGLLTFTGNTGDWYGFGFGVLWTLTIEFWFYVTFPILLMFATSTRSALHIIIAMIAVSLASKLMGIEFGVLNYYDHFLIGALCALSVKTNAIPSFLRSRASFWVAIIALLIFSRIHYPGSRNLLWHAESLSAAIATACAILSGYVNPPTLKLPWLAYLGRISYSTYLLHAVILDVITLYVASLATFPISVLWWPIYIALVVTSSAITFRFIELPVERRARMLFRYRFDLADSAAPSAQPTTIT